VAELSEKVAELAGANVGAGDVKYQNACIKIRVKNLPEKMQMAPNQIVSSFPFSLCGVSGFILGLNLKGTIIPGYFRLKLSNPSREDIQYTYKVTLIGQDGSVLQTSVTKTTASGNTSC